ncbi:MAG: translation initiation factor [Bacteroidales bacterium]|nr:translation initiation factor [Bacteroidales bacterium]
MKNNDWKDRLNIVFSTNPDFKFEEEQENVEEKLPNNKQTLRIELDKRNRKGKSVTLVTGYVGSDDDLAVLAKKLKVQCGSGGSSRCGEILIQGDFRQKINEILLKDGYKTKVI